MFNMMNVHELSLDTVSCTAFFGELGEVPAFEGTEGLIM